MSTVSSSSFVLVFELLDKLPGFSSSILTTCKESVDLPSSEFISFSSSSTSKACEDVPGNLLPSEDVPAVSPFSDAASFTISLSAFPSALLNSSDLFKRVVSPFCSSLTNMSLTPSGNKISSPSFPSVKSTPPSIQHMATAASLATAMLLVRGTAPNTGIAAVLVDAGTEFAMGKEVGVASQVRVPEKVPELAAVDVLLKDTD